MRGKRLLFRDVYYVLGFQKKLSLDYDYEHNPHLDVIFSNNRCFIVATIRENIRLLRVWKNKSCFNFQLVDGEEKLMFIGENLKRQEVEQQIHYTLSADFYEEKKSLKESEDEAVKQDDASSKKQKKKLLYVDLPRCGGGEFKKQAKFYVDVGKVDYSANIHGHLTGESMVKQRLVTCSSSTLLDTVQFQLLIENFSVKCCGCFVWSKDLVFVLGQATLCNITIMELCSVLDVMVN